jgi:hypothetical protein
MAFQRKLLKGAILTILLLALVPATTMAAEWVPPELNTPSDTTPDVTTDAAGNSAAVWVDGGHVFVAERPNGGPWVESADLQPDGNAESQSPKIVALPNGKLVALWVVSSDVYAAQKPPGGAWGGPDLISTECCVELVDLVAGADGTAIGYWVSGDGNPQTGTLPSDSATWGPPQDLFQGDADTKLAVAPDGSAEVVTPSNCDGQVVGPCIVSSHRPAGGDWITDPSQIATVNLTGLALAARPDASFTLVWSEDQSPDGRVVSADRPAGEDEGWSSPETTVADISGAVPGCSSSSVGCLDLASRGTALLAVWQQGAGFLNQTIASSQRNGSGSWSDAEPVGDAGARDADPQGALTVDGVAVAAWVVNGGGLQPFVARGAHRTAGGSWTQEDLGPAETSSEPSDLSFGDVVADGLGDAIAGWFDEAGMHAVGFDGTAPSLTASFPASGSVGTPLQFSASAADNWSGPPRISWLFGDGTGADGASVSHTYAAPGTYTASVTATDGAGNAAGGGTGSGASSAQVPVSPSATPTPTPTPTPDPCGTTDRDQDGINDACDRTDGSRIPVPFKTFNATVISGDVFVRSPAGYARASQGAKAPRGFRRLEGAETLRIGSILDTNKGRVLLRSAANTRRRVQLAQFFSGRFMVRQFRRTTRRRSTGLITELRLNGSSFRRACRTTTASTSARRSRKRVRRLFGDGKGSFRTKGRNAAATVRGTRWGVQDRCDGTLVRVQQGRVSVRDFVRRKTVILRTGQAYLARRR